MNEIWNEIAEQTLVMSDDQHRVLLATKRIHALGDDAQGIDVESGIGLVEDGQLRIEYGHLEDLVALFLAAREAFIHRSVHERFIELDELHLFACQLEELHGIE